MEEYKEQLKKLDEYVRLPRYDEIIALFNKHGVTILRDDLFVLNYWIEDTYYANLMRRRSWFKEGEDGFFPTKLVFEVYNQLADEAEVVAEFPAGTADLEADLLAAFGKVKQWYKDHPDHPLRTGGM